MNTFFEILKEITAAGFSIWMFFTFGLPLIIAILALFATGFSKDGFLSWNGRMNRLSYLVNIIIAYVALFLGLFIVSFALPRNYVLLSMGGFIILFLAILRSFAMTARRLHDLNFPGIITLARYAFNIIFGDYEFAKLCALFINILILIWPGNKESNQYGEVPDSGISY